MTQAWAGYLDGLRLALDEQTSIALFFTIRIGSCSSRTDARRRAAAQRPGNQRDAVTAGFEVNRRFARAGGASGSSSQLQAAGGGHMENSIPCAHGRLSGSASVRGHALQLSQRVKRTERGEFEAHQVRLAER